MDIGLFIPCYIDQFYPQVGVAALRILENHGCRVHYPVDQTCCGQPLANSGYASLTSSIQENYFRVFADFEYVVCPSASCAYHVRHHFENGMDIKTAGHLKKNTLDLVEFLVDVLKIDSLDVSFPFRVGIHESCHGLRGARMASSSELVATPFSKWTYLLQLIPDIDLVRLERKDECCGFGGTFAVKEPAISAKMGKDRIEDHMAGDAQYITSGDMSCLMHMEGIISRLHLPVKVIHIAEILNGGPSKSTAV